MRAALSVVLILGLAAVSVALTAVEAAFSLLKRRRLGHVALANPRAETANVYLDDPLRLLMPIQIGTYAAHIGMTVLLTSLLLDWLGHGAILVALLVMSAYLFAFRLALPYAMAQRNPERVLLMALPAFHSYATALSPVVGSLRRWLGMEAQGKTVASSGEDGAAGGAGGPAVKPEPEEDRRLASAVERFASVIVRNVMTPRPDVVAVPDTLTVSEARKVLGETKFSRVPVYHENLDDIVGIVGVRDLVASDAAADDPIEGLVRPVRLVPESKRVSDLLRELQSEHVPLAVVIDEYGGTAGLVSMEDIVEELVGEIKDEYDSEAEPIVQEAEGLFLVDGRVTIDRLEEALGTRLCEEEDVGTAGGLAVKVFGRIPRPGQRATHAGFALEVTEADRKRVCRVRFRRLPQEELGS